MKGTILELLCLRGIWLSRPSKRPAKLVKAFKRALMKMNEGEKEAVKANKNISRYLDIMSDIMFGKNNKPPKQQLVKKLADQLCKNDMFKLMIQDLTSLNFENRKSVVVVYNYFIRKPDVENYICSNPEILYTIIDSYENSNISLNCGSMLQETANIESLTRILLYSESFSKLFTYIDSSIFHVSSDSINTLKALLTKHKVLSSDYLSENYDNVFTLYDKLLKSENYVVCWQSLKLLSEILRDEKFRSVMHQYTAITNNFKQILKLLKRSQRNIQYEAFHVFGVFVANPDKTKEVTHLILKIKNKLLKFLNHFQEERNDEKFHKEKLFVIQLIQDLKPVS